MRALASKVWAPLLVVLFVQGALVAGRHASRQDAPEPIAASGPLMVAAGGPLLELSIQFHRPGAEIFLAVYRQLFAAFDPSTEVRVVVSDEADRALFEQARLAWRRQDGTGPAVRYVLVGRPITSWARDRLAVLEPMGAGPLTLLAPPVPMTGVEARANDWLVPWSLREAMGADARLVRASFRFEGGDLIADEDRVYVATPLFERNPFESEGRVMAQLEHALGRPVVRFGRAGHPSPSHHIGMFVTPVGDGVVLYGDPTLGLELVGVQTTLEVGGAPLTLDRTATSREPFAEVQRTLAASGRRTLALPLLMSDQPHAWLSYDNALMERRDGRLHVYMPSYGVPALDQRAKEIYESVGAVVHPIDVSHLFRLGGTVRCLVAPLRRGT